MGYRKSRVVVVADVKLGGVVIADQRQYLGPNWAGERPSPSLAKIVGFLFFILVSGLANQHNQASLVEYLPFGYRALSLDSVQKPLALASFTQTLRK